MMISLQKNKRRRVCKCEGEGSYAAGEEAV
jgi:hypothetical protein